MSYYQAGNFDLAVKYLTEARRLDPAHFSHPQLMLADIYARRGNPRYAADVLDEFLRHHPDYANAAAIRNQSEALRKAIQSPTK
jgi:tetratricopeptide (TPR) repeat protein